MQRIVFSKQADHDREMFPFWYYWYTRVFRADRILVTPVKTPASEIEAACSFYNGCPGVIVDPLSMETWHPGRVWKEQLERVAALVPDVPYLAVSADADQFYEYVEAVPSRPGSLRFRQVYMGSDKAPSVDRLEDISFILSEEDETAGFVSCLDSPDVGITAHAAGPLSVPPPAHLMFHNLLHGMEHFRKKVSGLKLDPGEKTSSHWRTWLKAAGESGEEGLQEVYEDMFRRGALNPAEPGLLQRFVAPVLEARKQDEAARARIAGLAGKSRFSMNEEEYWILAERLLQKGGCRLLVFGLGEDSGLWMDLNQKGRTVFLEHDEAWIARTAEGLPDADIRHVTYTSLRKTWREDLARERHESSLELPPGIAEIDWDIILVDGPCGHSDETPGRVQSLAAAASLAGRGRGTEIFVHDCDRELEASCCLELFGKERLVRLGQRMAWFSGAR